MFLRNLEKFGDVSGYINSYNSLRHANSPFARLSENLGRTLDDLFAWTSKSSSKNCLHRQTHRRAKLFKTKSSENLLQRTVITFWWENGCGILVYIRKCVHRSLICKLLLDWEFVFFISLTASQQASLSLFPIM